MKKLMLGVVMTAVAVTVQAEPIRTLLTKENQLPEKGQTELGLLANTQQYDNNAGYSETPYVRYGLFGNLAAYAFVPYNQTRYKDGFGLNQNGFGDMGIGFELLAYEDIFKFPYVLPHLEFRFPTGDQDKGYSAGDVSILGGVTVGTKTWECVNWAVDVTGEHLTTQDPSLKADTIVVSGSIVWDLDEQFSVVAEVNGSDQDYPLGHPLTYEGGMVYKPIESLMVGVYGGRTIHTGEDWNGTVKVAYSF